MKKYKILLLLLLIIQQVGISQSNDLVTIKNRVIEELFLIKTHDKAIETILSKLNEDGSFNDINYSDLSRNASFPHGQHTSNLASLGKAFNTKTSVFYQSEKVKNSIIKGLEFWIKNDFVGDNWHDNQITTPTNLVNLMLAMGNDLPKDLVSKTQPIINRANMESSGARPSGDRIFIAGLVAKNCLFLGKDAAFEDIIKIIAEENADDIVIDKARPPTFINLIKLILKKTFNISPAMLENKIILILLMAFACLNMMALKIQKGS
jgi:chondroitin AC lyase